MCNVVAVDLIKNLIASWHAHNVTWIVDDRGKLHHRDLETRLPPFVRASPCSRNSDGNCFVNAIISSSHSVIVVGQARIWLCVLLILFKHTPTCQQLAYKRISAYDRDMHNVIVIAHITQKSSLCHRGIGCYYRGEGSFHCSQRVKAINGTLMTKECHEWFLGQFRIDCPCSTIHQQPSLVYLT